MLSFWICEHHSAQFIKFLLIKLIILYIRPLNVSHIQNDIEMKLFDIPNTYF